MLDSSKNQYLETNLRKNQIETFDNLLMKMDEPSYEGTFYDVYKISKITYPIELNKDVIFE